MYQYVKKTPPNPIQLERQQATTKFWQRLKTLFPTIMITVGASLLIAVGYPILSYELTTARQAKRSGIISPISDVNKPYQPQVLAKNLSFAETGSTVDYSQISSWFNFDKPQTFLSPSNITHYTVTIPKLRIKDALVTIGGDDLDLSLIQYGGTANPGEAGNPVIFGHSVLPQFYSPKSYRAIFSLLPSLSPGDEIQVNFDGIIYKYTVYEYYEVSPDEVDILEQRYNHQELTLVTCVPPGTYWRRGIIKARLTEI